MGPPLPETLNPKPFIPLNPRPKALNPWPCKTLLQTLKTLNPQNACVFLGQSLMVSAKVKAEWLRSQGACPQFLAGLGLRVVELLGFVFGVVGFLGLGPRVIAFFWVFKVLGFRVVGGFRVQV